MDAEKASGTVFGHHEEVPSGENSEKVIGGDFTVDVENKRALKGDDSNGAIDWNYKTILATLCLGALYTGSQLPIYFLGGSLSFVVADIGGASKSTWYPVANTLATASTAPFSGYLQDLIGRRNITLFGGGLILIGLILLGTAHHFGQAVAGLAISGCGTGIAELSALAGISELVPVKHRGYYIGIVTGFVLPFGPYVLYCQLLGEYSTWRWGTWLVLMFNGLALVGLIFWYHPQSHPRAMNMETTAILKRIDYLGGFLSTTGCSLFLVGLQSGGYTHPWVSAYVLSTLIIGFSLMVAFVLWEWRGAAHPMIPHQLFQGQNIVALIYVIAFVAGLNFYSLINFLPLSFGVVYDPNPILVGTRTLGFGLGGIFAAVSFNGALSFTKGRNREVMLAAAVLACSAIAGLACMTPHNPKTIVALGTLGGIGVGGLLVPSAAVAIMVVPDSLIATAGALSLSLRVLGGSIGYTIYSSVFDNKIKTKLPAYIAEYATEAGLPNKSVNAFVTALLSDPKMAKSVEGVTPAILQNAALGMRWAYADSLRYVWYVSIPFGVLLIIACSFLKSSNKFLTNRISVGIKQSGDVST